MFSFLCLLNPFMYSALDLAVLIGNGKCKQLSDWSDRQSYSYFTTLWKFNFGRIFTPTWRSPRPASCGERAKWSPRTRTTLTRRVRMGEQIRGQSNFYKIFMKKYLCEQECIYILIFEIQMKYKDCFFYWISNLQTNGFFRSFRLRRSGQMSSLHHAKCWHKTPAIISDVYGIQLQCSRKISAILTRGWGWLRSRNTEPRTESLRFNSSSWESSSSFPFSDPCL